MNCLDSESMSSSTNPANTSLLFLEPGQDLIISFTCNLSFLFHSWWRDCHVFQCLQLSLHFCQNLFQFHRKFQIVVLLNFHPNYESSRSTHHDHTQTKLRGKSIYMEKAFHSCLIWLASTSITFHLLLTPTSSLVEYMDSHYLMATPHT